MGNTNSTLLNREEAEKALFGTSSDPQDTAPPLTRKLSVKQRYDFNNRLTQLQQLIESDLAPDSLKKVPYLSKDQQKILLRKYMHREIFTAHQGSADLPSNPQQVIFRESYLVHRDYKSVKTFAQPSRPPQKVMVKPSCPPQKVKPAYPPQKIQATIPAQIVFPDSNHAHTVDYDDRTQSLQLSEASFSSEYSERDFEPPSPKHIVPEIVDLRDIPLNIDSKARLQQQICHPPPPTEVLTPPKQRSRSKSTVKPFSQARPRSKSDGQALKDNKKRYSCPPERLIPDPDIPSVPKQVKAPHASMSDLFDIPAPKREHKEKQELPEKTSLFKRLTHRRRSMPEKRLSAFLMDHEELNLSLTVPAIPLEARKMTSEPEDSPLVANRLSSLTRDSSARPVIPVRPGLSVIPGTRAKSMYIPRQVTQEEVYPFQARPKEFSKTINDDLSTQRWSLPNVAKFLADSESSKNENKKVEKLERKNTVAYGAHILDAGIPPKVPTHRSSTLKSQSSGYSSYSSEYSSNDELSSNPLSTDIYTRKCSYRRPKLETRKTEPPPRTSVSTVAEVDTPPVSPEDNFQYEQEIEEEIAARQFMLGGYKRSSTQLKVVNWEKDALMTSTTDLSCITNSRKSSAQKDISPVPSQTVPSIPSQAIDKIPRIYHNRGGSDAFSFEVVEQPCVSAAQQVYLDLIDTEDMWSSQAKDYFDFST